MADPKDLDAYNTRFEASYKVTGFGIGNVWCHMPCPFCAAPDFVKYEILSMRETISKNHKCAECERSARFVFTSDPNTTSFEMVQTGGSDPPLYLPPMRRMPK